jgi:hypothetical protein
MGCVNCASNCGSTSQLVSVSNGDVVIVGCGSILAGRLGSLACSFTAGFAGEEIAVLGTGIDPNFLSSEEETDGEEGVYFFSAIVGLSGSAVVDEIGILLLDGTLVLPTAGTSIGIEILRGTGKLLEAPFDDFVVFPLGTDAGADMITPPCGEATLRVPQFGQKCAVGVSNGVLQRLQLAGLCMLLYGSLHTLVVSVNLYMFSISYNLPLSAL